jgi:hypothetical protein
MFSLIPRAYLFGGIAVALLGLFVSHKLLIWSAHRDGFKAGVASEQTKARIEAAKRIVEMEKNDEAFRSLPARDKCLAIIRDSGLPEHHCNTDAR